MAVKKIGLISLKAGDYDVTVAPEIGGSIASYRYLSPGRAVDIFRPLRNLDHGPDRVLEMGCFPLVPYSNRIREGKIMAGDGTARLPKNNPPEPHPCHGTGWKSPWDIVDQTAHSLTLVLPPNADFPLIYKAHQHISLTPLQLEITLSVTNLGKVDFPAGLGLHPYFPARKTAEIIAGLPQEWALDAARMPTERVKNPAFKPFQMGQNAQDLKEMSAYCGWDGAAVIRWPDLGTALFMTTEPPLAHLLIWAPAGKAFFCAEPASHAIDGFNLAAQGIDAVGGVILAPNRTLTQKFIFRPRF